MNTLGDDGKGDKDPCPLQYCDFSFIDHAKMCPLYTSLLTRNSEQGIEPEEMDLLLSDLETLLAAANRRMRLLESENKLLVDWSERKDKKVVRQKELEILNSLSNFKRGAGRSLTGEEVSSKKQKLDDSKTAFTGAGRSKKVGSKNQSSDASEDDSFSTSSKGKVDAPNRFWAAVEPYCAEITMEDLKFLEDSMKPEDDEQEYFKVPTLGKHYSDKWAQEDLLEEQNEGARLPEKGKRGALSNATSDNTSKKDKSAAILKKANTAGLQTEDEGCAFGSLTQRLVSALIEENMIAPMTDQILNNDKKSSETTTTRSGNNPPRTPVKTPHVPHTRTLEARIKEELMFQGLLDSEDQGDEDNDDEVLSELKRHQNELHALIAHSRQQKQDLYKLAQEEMKRQELRHRGQLADAEVMEAFRKLLACKQKRKSPTKKEKDSAYKVLKEREAIFRVLGNT